MNAQFNFLTPSSFVNSRRDDRLLVRLALLTFCLLLPVTRNIIRADDNALTARELESVRHIYVPNADLGAAIRHDPYGAILTREEFDKLLAGATTNIPDAPSTADVIIRSADYQVQVADDRLQAVLTIDMSTSREVSAARFDVTGWNIENARLDDDAAMIARNGEMQNELRVLLPSTGRHRLTLSMSTAAPGSGKRSGGQLSSRGKNVGRIPDHDSGGKNA